MESTAWQPYLSERDDAVLDAVPAGSDVVGTPPRREPGAAPVVLAIDLQRHLVGEDVPILDSVGRYRTSMGEYAHRALEQVEPFLESARAAGVPVVYTRVIPGPESGLAGDDVEIVDRLAPREDEVVIDKSYSSSFYGTDLLTRLVRGGVDTVVVLGCSTGGCVRATAVDAYQHGFSVLVPSECTFDRVQAVRAMTLFEIDRYYGSVLPRSAIEGYFETLHA